MRIGFLKAFVVLADVGSFHVAAKSLNITQPALTRRIQKLEETLNTPLIDRAHNTFRLTAPGIYFLERARTIVLDAETVVADLQQSKMRRGGQIRIACLPSIGLRYLPKVIGEFEKQFPRVSLNIQDVNAIQLNELVLSGDVDIGFGLKVNENPKLNFEVLFSEPLGIVCNTNHPIAKAANVTWSDLADYPVAFNVKQSGNWLLIQEQLGPMAQKPNWFHQVHSVLGGLMLIRNSNALGALPLSLVEALEMPDLVFKRVSDPEIIREIAIVRRQKVALTGYAETFLDLLIRHCKEQAKKLP
ncbi:MAG: hypothetical protein COB93_08245 [Sneathiella sp.]|nr:MAG: hypothetical protein COB93_08245 [Sneathiella sp.]